MTKLPDICLWSFDSPSEEAKHNVSTLDSADKAEDMHVHGESPLPSPPLSPNRSFTGGGNSASSDPDTEKDWAHHNVPSAREKSAKPSVSVPKGLLQKVRLTSTRATSSSPGQSQATDAVQLILRGERYNATFKGISQYTEGGSSACGLATLNATRLAFDLCLRRKDCEELISSLTSEEFVRAAMGIAGYWQNDMHLEVEHILQLPLFSKSVQVMSDQYAECTYRTFANAIRSLRLDPDSPGPRALCVTRPPEVIGVIHIPLLNSTSKPSTLQTSNSRTKSIYLVFDSHPRPNHPDGAAIQIFPSQSVADVANYLMSLFRVDQDIIDDPELEWTAQLLGQVSYHVLAPSSGPDTKDEYAINMRILEDARKCALAEEKLKAAEAETKKLKNQVLNQQQEISRLNITIRNLRTRETQSFGSYRSKTPQSPRELQNTPWGSVAKQAAASMTPKGKEREWQAPTPLKDERGFLSWLPGKSQGRESNGSNTLRANTAGSLKRTGSRLASEPSPWGKAASRPPPPSAPTSSRLRMSSSLTNERSRAAAAEEDARLLAEARSLELALSLQQQFDDETIEFSMAESLAQSLDQPKFTCGICMEILPDEAISRIDGCGHSCCRDCLRGDIQTKIEDRRYPIFCPFCVVGPDGDDDDDEDKDREVGIIPAWVVETIGISPELFNIFTELQLAEHSIMIDCRG
ncbi:unnamed protein product [Rhizoctonia solani]|uniref:RING-type domain-containing protein n=1 Tax=Rhizoctonia solani TaxID=456999 RepID=A0A8H2W8B1_9AGAM|nr:unnamed protein product [Rhizoctonia solani]